MAKIARETWCGDHLTFDYALELNFIELFLFLIWSGQYNWIIIIHFCSWKSYSTTADKIWWTCVCSRLFWIASGDMIKLTLCSSIIKCQDAARNYCSDVRKYLEGQNITRFSKLAWPRCSLFFGKSRTNVKEFIMILSIRTIRHKMGIRWRRLKTCQVNPFLTPTPPSIDTFFSNRA